MTADQLQTSIGPATVRHRLAVAVECLGALSDRVLAAPVTVTLEPTGPPPHGVSRSLHRTGTGRFVLTWFPPLPDAPVLRVDDPTRVAQPRRIAVHPWLPDEIAEPAPYVPAGARLVRLRLWPGTATRPPRGTTTVRGRVVRDGVPARWCRVLATGPTGVPAGRAHTDERGEFLLVVLDTGLNPVTDSVTLDLRVTAARVPPPVDPDDRCADLVIEDVPRSANPPQPGDLDTAVLRGTAVPPGFAPNQHPPRAVAVRIGTENNLSGDPLVFAPQP